MRTHASGDAAQGVSRGGNQPPLSTSSLHLTSARRTHRRFLASSNSNPSKLPLRSEQAPIPIRASSVSNPSRLRLRSELAPVSIRACSDPIPCLHHSDIVPIPPTYPSQPLLSSPQLHSDNALRLFAPALWQKHHCFAAKWAQRGAKRSLSPISWHRLVASADPRH